MRALVTGATGFLGRALTERLIRSGYWVRCLVRNPSKLSVTLNDNLDVFPGDLRNPSDVGKATKDIDLVFHLAAVYREAGLPEEEYWNTNVSGTENLLKASVKNSVKKFIFCSTVGVHGHITNLPADENYPLKPNDVYQKTKVESEKIVFKYYKEHNLPVVIIRPTAIYGPGDLRLLKLFKLVRNGVTILIGSGEYYYQMVYIEDLVDAFIRTATNNFAVGEVFIIGGEKYYTLNEILDIIERIMKRKNLRIYLPYYPFRIAALISERVCSFLKISPFLYKRRISFFSSNHAFSIDKAKRILNFSPRISLNEGLELTYRWYKENKYL